VGGRVVVCAWEDTQADAGREEDIVVVLVQPEQGIEAFHIWTVTAQNGMQS
jgi:hypothetical protein